MAEPITIPQELLKTNGQQYSTGPDIVFVKFQDSKVPVFKEQRSKDYIAYGEKNDYPEYLTYLFNKSPNHGAIITGKADYIFGKGFENGDIVINRLGDTLNDIAKKINLDVEIYGGFRVEIIWNAAGKISDIYHVDFTTLRVGKEGGFWWKECWDIKNNREQPIFIPDFNPTQPTGSQIFSYNEYRPMSRYYPLPGYIQCNNAIETDIEISKFNLSSICNGMAPSKLIQFFKGEPPEEKKKEIELGFKRKFAGAENAGKFVLVFNDANSVNQTVQVDDLSGSDLDKMYIELSKSVQQSIFTGHKVTSGMLFGIKTEGQLGGDTELQTAYAIFQNTYSKPKADTLSKEVTSLMKFTAFPGEYELQPADPIGVQFDVKDVINALPKVFVFKQLGIPEDMWSLPNIGSDNKPTDPTATPAANEADLIATNPHVKNLSAKQYQQLLRIRRDYIKGRIDLGMAMTMLRTSMGLPDADLKTMLGVQASAMSAVENDDSIIAMFDACGYSKDDFEILKSKRVSFSQVEQAEDDESIYIQEAFKTYDVTRTEDRILELIKKDKRITPEVIAEVTGQTVAYVEGRIESLIKRGYLEQTEEKIGEDIVFERLIPASADISAPPPIAGSVPPAKIFIKYSYEGPQDDRNRPFCAKMLKLNRLYSRADIEKISQRLGYSVFDRRGGFWTHKDGNITPYCRHNWKSNIVVQKGGAA